MNHILMLIVVIIILTLVFTGILRAQNKTTHRTDLTTEQFKEYLTRDPKAVLIDVRTPEEFAAGHLKSAINISVTDPAFEKKVAGFAKDKPVLVYCRSGHRSAVASGKLATLGFINILNLEKGINSWQAAGEAVVK